MNRLLDATMVAFIGLFSCSNSSAPIAGGATDSPNARVSAVVFRTDSTPAAGATVRLRPADFLAGGPESLLKRAASIADRTTDINGRLSFDGLSSGPYCIEVTDRESTAVLMSFDIATGDDRLDLGADTLRRFVRVGGTVAPDSNAGAFEARIYGLERIVAIDRVTGAYSFGDLPAGNFSLRIVPRSIDYGAEIVTLPFVAPGGSVQAPLVVLTRFVDEDYSLWAYSASIALNTSPTGADVAGDVFDFPLLIRLDSAVIDMSQADPRGIDIRFAKADGSKLRYQIERWDPAARLAAIWVLVDTVRGNDTNQSLRMFWGRPGASDLSCGPAVFGVGDRDNLVWHLGENPDLGRGNAVIDHSGNSNHGTSYRTMTGANLIPGVAGLAMHFGGHGTALDHSIICYPMRDTIRADMTLSFWYRLVEAQPYNPRMVDMGLNATVSSGSRAGFDNSGGPDTVVEGPATGLDNAWHYYAATRSGTAYSLYVDGAYAGGCGGTIVPYSFLSVAHLFSDTIAPYTYFKGDLDELRITSYAQTPSRVKLAYENGKGDQRLLRFK